MGEIVNLKRARKRKARLAEDARAAERRALHGRGKAEKDRETHDQSALHRHLDGHRVEPSDP